MYAMCVCVQYTRIGLSHAASKMTSQIKKIDFVNETARSNDTVPQKGWPTRMMQAPKYFKCQEMSFFSLRRQCMCWFIFWNDRLECHDSDERGALFIVISSCLLHAC